MITVKLNDLTLKFCFGFFFSVCIAACMQSSNVLYSLFFCILHEFGHLLWMRAYRVKISQIRFYGAGIKISSLGVSELAGYKQVIIYSGGCLINLLLSVIMNLINAHDLAAMNLVIMVYNLLPIYGFDGDKILSILFPSSKQMRIAVSTILSFIIFIFVLISVIYLSKIHGFEFLFITIILIFCDISE